MDNNLDAIDAMGLDPEEVEDEVLEEQEEMEEGEEESEVEELLPEKEGGEEFDFDDELSSEFGDDIVEQQRKADLEQLEQDTVGFASCFPDWDLHPPRK